MAEIRCELTELIEDQCAHCRLPVSAPATESTKAEKTKALQAHIEDLMLVMNASRVKKDSYEYGGFALPLRTFDRAEPFVSEITHAEYRDEIHTEVWPADLDDQVDITVIGRVTSPSVGGEHLAVRRFRSVRRARLPLAMRARYMVEENRLFLNRETGTGLTSLRYYGINQPHREAWLDLQRGKPLIKLPNGGEIALLWISLGLQFNRDYYWHVHLRWAGAEAGVYMPTTAAGARELFKLRDYEPGASRRKALIHWVSEHSRRIRKDTDEETLAWVREHMRGATSFKWQDMEGAIEPSGYDLRRLAEGRVSRG